MTTLLNPGIGQDVTELTMVHSAAVRAMIHGDDVPADPINTTNPAKTDMEL